MPCRPWVTVPKMKSLVTILRGSRTDGDRRVASEGSELPAQFCVAKTGHEMIVDHAGGLHKGVANGAADEAPDVGVKGAEFFLHFEEGAGVADGGVDFKAVAHDSSVAEQFADLLLVVVRHFLRIKSVKHFAIPRALLQDRVPAQSRLRPFQHQELKPFML